MKDIKIDLDSWFYKNCKRQRKVGAKICQVCPFREYIEDREKKIEDEKDIVERLAYTAKQFKIKRGPSAHRTTELLDEAAREIEELRSLIDAMKEGN